MKNGAVLSGFAERLKTLRVQRNLAQIELAQKAGVSNILISRYERGVTKPTAESLKKIAEILEVSSDYLFEGTEEGGARVKFADRRVLSVFQQLENLPNKEKDFILSVLIRLLKAHKFETLATEDS